MQIYNNQHLKYFTSKTYNFFSNLMLGVSDNFSQQPIYTSIRRFGTHPLQWINQEKETKASYENDREEKFIEWKKKNNMVLIAC